MKKSKTKPDQKELALLAEKLIEKQFTMTIGTAQNGIPWCAPVYYVFISPDFFFFSSPSSRHIKEAISTGRASCAIFAESNTWKDIKGLQMAGTIEEVSSEDIAYSAFKEYKRKFPLLKELFQRSGSLTLNVLIRAFSVRLYRFRPQLIYYLDNSIEFGFRERIEFS